MSSKAKLHARRRAARFGDLDALLSEALKSKRIGEGAVKRLKGINMAIHEAYANPANWVERGVLTIIYTDERTGESITVGKFQESIHRTGARRLTRVSDDIPVRCVDSNCCAHSFNVEEFHDPFLVRGKPIVCPPAPKDPLAQMAIRAYIERTKPVRLDEFLGSKVDAAKLLSELRNLRAE